MIYKIAFKDGRIDWCTAKSRVDLLKEYEREFTLTLLEIESVEQITEEQARNIMVRDPDFNPKKSRENGNTYPLLDLCDGDEFQLIASTEID